MRLKWSRSLVVLRVLHANKTVYFLNSLLHTLCTQIFLLSLKKCYLCYLVTCCAVVSSFFLFGRGQYLSFLHLPEHECGVHQTRNHMGVFGCQAACLTAEDRFRLIVRVIKRGAVVTFQHVFMSLYSTEHRHAFTLPFDEPFSDNKLFY